MKPASQTYHHGDLRRALVEAATARIAAGGVESFSLREAARDVGVSANAAYRHFEDKSALLVAVSSAAFDRLSLYMQEQTAQAEPTQPAALARLKATGRAYIAFALEHPALFRLMFSPQGISCAQKAQEHARSLQTPYQRLGEALDDLVAEGLLPAHRREGAELKAWTVVHGFVALVQSGRLGSLSSAAQTRAIEDLLAFVVEGLCGAAPAR